MEERSTLQTQTENGACFTIKNVDVEGVTLLSPAALTPVLLQYENKCTGLADINVLLKNLTNLYIDAGYIMSRVYVPEQDIAGTKVLRLVAAEGTLSDIYLNGKPAEHPGILITAFPGMKDKAVNIRDVEQGLDQIRHGHTRSWNELNQQMQNALRNAGVVNSKGKIK